jgi:hypothetical protein
MPTAHTDLSSLPPATLRAALEASEDRTKREKKKIQREIRKLQKQLGELEQGADASEPEVEPDTPVVSSGSRRPVKRLRADSPSPTPNESDEEYEPSSGHVRFVELWDITVKRPAITLSIARRAQRARRKG